MKIRNFICAVFLFFAPALQADAVYLSYSPSDAVLTIAPGGEMTTGLTITLNDVASGTYSLWFADSIMSNNLPLSWISAAPDTAFISAASPSVPTILTVKLPPDTLPGTYSGYLFSRAMSSHGPADPGTGMLLEIVVPSFCSNTAAITITSFSPEVIWPPDHKMKDVVVSGYIALPDGCNLKEIGYVIDDEYGIYTGVGSIVLDETGYFTAYIPVEAWRYGKDKDGRHYVIKIFAENEAGITESQTLNAVVPHDQRNKKKKK